MAAVEVRDLTMHVDARGWLMELVRCDSEFLPRFGQVYVTTCNPGVVKGWHRHKLQTDALACVWGMARVVTATQIETASRSLIAYTDGRPNEFKTVIKQDWAFEEYVVGPLSPKAVIVPPGTWHAFAPVGNEPCVIVNTVSEPYNYDDPDEERLPIGDIPFEWESVSG